MDSKVLKIKNQTTFRPRISITAALKDNNRAFALKKRIRAFALKLI